MRAIQRHKTSQPFRYELRRPVVIHPTLRNASARSETQFFARLDHMLTVDRTVGIMELTNDLEYGLLSGSATLQHFIGPNTHRNVARFAQWLSKGFERINLKLQALQLKAAQNSEISVRLMDVDTVATTLGWFMKHAELYRRNDLAHLFQPLLDHGRGVLRQLEQISAKVSCGNTRAILRDAYERVNDLNSQLLLVADPNMSQYPWSSSYVFHFEHLDAARAVRHVLGRVRVPAKQTSTLLQQVKAFCLGDLRETEKIIDHHAREKAKKHPQLGSWLYDQWQQEFWNIYDQASGQFADLIMASHKEAEFCLSIALERIASFATFIYFPTFIKRSVQYYDSRSKQSCFALTQARTQLLKLLLECAKCTPHENRQALAAASDFHEWRYDKLTRLGLSRSAAIKSEAKLLAGWAGLAPLGFFILTDFLAHDPEYRIRGFECPNEALVNATDRPEFLNLLRSLPERQRHEYLGHLTLLRPYGIRSFTRAVWQARRVLNTY